MKLDLPISGTSVTLTKNNFLASGGEGDIYVRGQTAYKIFHDPSKMMPIGKIAELSAIKDSNIIRPQEVLYKKKTPVGYQMRFVSNTIPLVQTFTKAFRERNGLNHDKMRNLIKILRKLIVSVHNAKILIVDLNEMNFLIDKSFDDVFGIDTDSYQTPSYPATAIMESIRDRHSNSFSENTDWFAYGILSFIMFTGIHPFKGKHPTIKLMDDRMKKNISVLSSDVKVPHVTYDFNIIPDAYMQWYRAIFNEGKRLPPPSDFQAVVVIQPTIRKISGSNNFNIEEIKTVKGEVISIHSHSTYRILTTSHFYFNTSEIKIESPVWATKNQKNGDPILSKIKNGFLKLFNVKSRREIDTNMQADQLMICRHNDNPVLYVKSGDNILQTDFIGNNNTVVFKSVANVLGQATQLYDGVAIQNLLGETYLSFFPKPDQHVLHAMKELNEYKVVDGKYDNHVIMLIGMHQKNGQYTRFVYRFDDKFESYDCRKEENVSFTAINFVCLDTGVAVCINEEEKVEAFLNRPNHPMMKIVDDPIIGGDMRLHSLGGKVLFSRESKLFTLSMT